MLFKMFTYKCSLLAARFLSSFCIVHCGCNFNNLWTYGPLLHIVSSIFFLYFKSNFDFLVIMYLLDSTHTYNPILHLWFPASSSPSSVKLQGIHSQWSYFSSEHSIYLMMYYVLWQCNSDTEFFLKHHEDRDFLKTFLKVTILNFKKNVIDVFGVLINSF